MLAVSKCMRESLSLPDIMEKYQVTDTNIFIDENSAIMMNM